MAYTSGGAALAALTLQVRRLAGLLAEAEDRLAAPHGQTGARAQVLACADPQPQTVATIARRLGLARQSVQRTADLLVLDELAEYHANPGDRRARLLGLTPAGQRTLTALETAQMAWANRVSAILASTDLDSADLAGQNLHAARQTLEQIARALKPERRARGAGGTTAPAKGVLDRPTG